MKKRKGITLIALVVTIVVLLILAVVTVALTLGEDGIIEKSKETKLDSRYGTIMDKVKAREMAIEMAFEKKEDGESREEFINRLEDEGLITKEDIRDESFSIIKLGEKKDGNYKYIIDIADGSYNNPNKNLTLIIETTVANEEVEIPIMMDNLEGLTINWDSKKYPNNFINPTTSYWIVHTYEKAGRYEVQIKGNLTKSATFGDGGDAELGAYRNRNIIGLKNWGENGFAEFWSFGGYLQGKIPSPSKNSFKNVIRFEETFDGCSGITSIPSNLFNMATNVTSFTRTFYNCTGLTSIPENLFATNTNVTSFGSTFVGCTGLTSIPENLFAKNTNVTSFSSTFDGCTGLISIPENLFAKNTNVTSFSSTFDGCTGLISIPENLFTKNTNVTSFGYTFYNCTSLTGLAPDIWNRSNVTSYSRCFYKCTGLSNYGSIKSGWK